MTLINKVDQFKADSDIAHQIVHGDDTTVVTTEGGPVRSFAKVIADSELESQRAIEEFENAGGVLTTAAEAAKNAAQLAQAQTESARDDAVAVVYEGDASLDPAPGKIPVARASGEIDAAWVGATELPAIKPSLLLDFANSKTVDPRITYAGASPMPYYDGKTVVKAEENLLTYSQNFSNSSWAKITGTAPSGSELAPDNTLTGTVLSEAASARAELVRSFPVISGLPYSLSIFAKENPASAKRYISLATGSGGFGGQSIAIFDLATGTKTFDNGGGTYTITADSNGYWRITNTDVATSSTSTQFVVYTSDNGTTTASAGGGSVIIWGAQLEQRSFVTAYTPTTTQPITRYQPKLLEAPANTPTITHDPVTGECLGLQVYGQATNLLTWSDAFDNAAWQKTDLTILTDQIVAPDGTLADTFVPAGSGLPRIRQGATFASGIYTSYLVIKKTDASSPAGINFSLVGTGGANGTVNIETGAVIGVPGGQFISGGVKDLGNGWRLVSARINNTFVGTTLVLIEARTASNNIYIGDGTSGIYIWRAGLYAGDYAGPPIKTEGSQVTRAAVTITPHADSGSLGEGTLYAEYAASSAVASIGTAAIPAPANRTRRKTAVAFDSTSTITVTDNGTAATTAGSAGASALTVGQVNGTLEKIAVYPQKLTATEAGALTS